MQPGKTISKKQDAMSPERKAKIMSLLDKGYTAEEIALHIAGKRNRYFRHVRGRIQRMASMDEEYQIGIGHQVNGAAIMELPSIMDGVIRRAQRGRVDAAKLIFEMTGLHNPKVQHEHSGDIQITLASVPRPERVATELEAPVVDAEVVEEDPGKT
jgi:hypothetical protein